VERRVPPRRSGTLTGSGSRERKLDRFDRDMLTFTLSWAPYGGPPNSECFVEFGMNADRVHERCMQVVCTARAADFGEEEGALLLRASQLLLGRPFQRDRRSIAPVARPNVNRFARRAAPVSALRRALTGRSATPSPTRTMPAESTPQ
jgi:hypothetical protein